MTAKDNLVSLLTILVGMGMLTFGIYMWIQVFK